MAKFNLIEHISKNKATFFGSLTEGQFSWMTQDTGQQIGSQDENKIPVYMFDDKGKYWFERDYEGYGVFGGKDYYELLDQMNGGKGDRSKGIDLAFDKSKEGETLFPALVVGPSNFNYRTHDFTKEAEHDPNQSWYDASYEEEDEDEDYGGFGDMDREEDYDYDEELDEAMNMNKDASGVAEKFAQHMSKKEGKKFTVTPGSVDEKSFDLDLDGEPYEGGSYLLGKNGDIINVAAGNEVYGNVKQLEEGEAAYEYEKGKEAGEKIEKKKMKVSELKAKIKEMVLSEMDGPAVEDEQYDFLREIEEMLNEAEGLTPLQDYVYQYEIEISGEDEAQEFLDDIRKLNTPQDVYDYYAYDRDWSGSMDDDLENIFRQVKRKFKNLNEAEDDKHVVMKGDKFYTGTEFVSDKEDAMKYNLETATEVAKKEKGMVYTLGNKFVKEAEEDVTDAEAAADAGAEEITTDTEVTTDVTTDEVDPNVKSVQDALTQAQAAAQQLGDKKLMDQIGNTITFFTRAHVVEKPKGAVAEGEEMKEGYFGANNEVEELIDTLGYENMDEFFSDNPGVITAILDWAAGVPEFRRKMIDNGLLEAKKENMNESMFPMLKKILK